MEYRVIKVSSKRELKDFIDLPFNIYKKYVNWVAPIKSELKRTLNKEKNPYFRNTTLDLFNCYGDNKVIARISISVDGNYCAKAGIKTAFFGFFEAFNDQLAVKLLFNKVFEFCRENEIKKIEGPFNPNLYSELGVLTGSYESSPTFFQTYNPEYYKTLFSENGFELLKVLHTRINEKCSEYLNLKYPQPLKLTHNNLTVRSFNIKDKETELENLRSIFNDAFSDNWHFTPVSKDEYVFASKYLKLVTPPDLIKFVEYKGEPVAVVHFVMDINPMLKKFKGNASIINYIKLLKNKSKIERLIIFAVGTKKEFRNSRVTGLLFNATVEVARKYRVLESTWMYDENKIIISLAEKLGLKRDKEYYIYSKNLMN